MNITCGIHPADNDKYIPIEWTWDSMGYLIQGSAGEDTVIQIEYEELMGLAAFFEKVKAERLKDEGNT